MKNIALILLGGNGNRLGSDIPKQFLMHKNTPIYIETIRRYEKVSLIDAIILVVNASYIEAVNADLANFNIKKVVAVIPGGSERFISSYYGVKKAHELFSNDDNILIADAVRPNTSDIIILANIFALNEANAVLTAIVGEEQTERIDTAHHIGSTTLLAQTPQSFKLGYIYHLYEKYMCEEDFKPTDEISIVELEKDSYVVVEGELENYKITHQEDLDRYLKS